MYCVIIYLQQLQGLLQSQILMIIKNIVKLIKQKGSVGIGEGTAMVDDKVVAKGELTFAIV